MSRHLRLVESLGEIELETPPHGVDAQTHAMIKALHLRVLDDCELNLRRAQVEVDAWIQRTGIVADIVGRSS